MSEEISQNQGTRISTPITRISTPITRISALITMGMMLALYLPKIMSISLSIRRHHIRSQPVFGATHHAMLHHLSNLNGAFFPIPMLELDAV